MGGAKINEDNIEAALTALVGRQVQRARLDADNVLSLYFRGPVVGGVEAGIRPLELFGCLWRIARDDVVVVGSGDESASVLSRVADLEGRELQDAILAPTGDLEVRFDGAFELTTFTVSTGDLEQWPMVHTPTGTWRGRGGQARLAATRDEGTGPDSGYDER